MTKKIENKKILFLINSLGSGGAQRQIVSLAAVLKDCDYNVTFILYYKDDFFAEHLLERDIKIQYCISKSYFFRSIAVIKAIRESNASTVVSFLEVPNFYNCLAAIVNKKWNVITSERSSKEIAFNTIRGKVINWFQRYSDYIVCNSYNSQALWLKYYPQYKDKLKVIYNLVFSDIDIYHETNRSTQKTNICVLSSYQYLKNPLNLIKAISLLEDSFKNRLIVKWYGRIESTQGDKAAYDEALALINILNLTKVIQLNAEVRNTIKVISEADFVGLFSVIEGLPNSICEAMTYGKPIIMTKVSDYSVLVDENNGYLCDWDDVISIKNALMKAICTTESEMRKMGEASRSKAKVLFSTSTIKDNWIDLINS